MQVMRAAPARLYGRCVRSTGRLTASGGMCASDETASVRLYGRCVRSIGRLTASGGMCASKTLANHTDGTVLMYIFTCIHTPACC